MLGLGFGDATPFATTTNHQTARNASFRHVSGYDAGAQTKRKCPSCGVWGRKASRCLLCTAPIPGPLPGGLAERCVNATLGKRSTTPTSRRAAAAPQPNSHRSNTPVRASSRASSTSLSVPRSGTRTPESTHRAGVDATTMSLRGFLERAAARKAVPGTQQDLAALAADAAAMEACAWPRSAPTCTFYGVAECSSRSVSTATRSKSPGASTLQKALNAAAKDHRIRCRTCGEWVLPSTCCRLCRTPAPRPRLRI